jgi:glycolate oxidase iron-sulfur subunit
MDGARALRAAHLHGWRRALARRRLDLLSDPRRLRWLALLAATYRRTGIAALLAWSGLLRSPRVAVLDALARRLQSPRRLRLPTADIEPTARRTRTQAPVPKPVALFVGCVARGLQGATAEASLRVLRRLGIAVRVPVDQGCCGAMHRHNGWPEAGDRLLERNTKGFGERPVVGFASACVVELKRGLDATEICRFLVDTPWPPDLRPRPLPGLTIVHEPCSHRNALRDSEAVYALLARIPALEVRAADGNGSCCGAAGTYLLDHARTAVTLGDEKARRLARQLRNDDTSTRPCWLVTTNTGCATHLAARLRAQGLSIEVLHPVELLDRQLGGDAADAIRDNEVIP